MAHVLVVTEQTLGGPELYEEVRQRSQRGPCRLYVVVPATGGEQEPAAPTGVVAGGTTSTTPASDPGVTAGTSDVAQGRAFDRLKEALARFEELDLERLDGEVGDPDPGAAVADAIEAHGPFDEVVLATPPASVSKWVKMDLASRIGRKHDVPVTHVEAAPTGDTD